MAPSASDTPGNGNGDGNDTLAAAQWIQDYLLSRPVRRSFSCFVEQALYDPLTAAILPPWANMALLLAVLGLVVVVTSSFGSDEPEDGSWWKNTQQKRRARARQRRQT